MRWRRKASIPYTTKPLSLTRVLSLCGDSDSRLDDELLCKDTCKNRSPRRPPKVLLGPRSWSSLERRSRKLAAPPALSLTSPQNGETASARPAPKASLKVAYPQKPILSALLLQETSSLPLREQVIH